MNVLLCEPSSNPMRVHSALEAFCEKCSQGVWVSPASKTEIAKHGEFQTLCVPCGLPLMRQAEKIPMPTAEQLDEIRESLGEHGAKRFAEFVEQFAKGVRA